MLVLTRRLEEAVVVGRTDTFEGLLRITVLEIRNGSVRLGFDAPAHVPVHRSEIFERMRANGEIENERAGAETCVLPAGKLNSLKRERDDGPRVRGPT